MCISSCLLPQEHGVCLVKSFFAVVCAELQQLVELWLWCYPQAACAAVCEWVLAGAAGQPCFHPAVDAFVCFLCRFSGLFLQCLALLLKE